MASRTQTGLSPPSRSMVTFQVVCTPLPSILSYPARVKRPRIFAPAASVLLPLRIAQARAEDLLYSGRSIDAPTALAISGSVNLPAAFVFSAMFYANAGTPYAWTVSSDVNGDGFNNNDAIYIPKSSSDVTLVTSTGAAASAADWDRRLGDPESRSSA